MIINFQKTSYLGPRLTPHLCNNLVGVDGIEGKTTGQIGLSVLIVFSIGGAAGGEFSGAPKSGWG
jgi:hypothetical protein